MPATLTRHPEAELRRRLVEAEARRRGLKPPEPKANRYQQDFLGFVRDCVWTIDEARAGVVRRFPTGTGSDGRLWGPIWEDLAEDLFTERLLFLEKSRRVLASWFVCAFDVWLAAGGQDPRWPELMLSTGNRSVLVAAATAQGTNGSEWFIERRIKAILDEFERRERHRWPEFPRWGFVTGQIEFENGSRIEGVPQGASKLRGGGNTFLHFEEVTTWPRLLRTLAGAQPTLLGGGHMCLICNSDAGTEAQLIRDGELNRRTLRGATTRVA